MQIEPEKFKKWIETNYTNTNTQRQYILAEVRFLNYVEEDNELNQEVLNKFIVFARNKNNPFYMGFIRAYIDCYDPEMNELKIVKDRSRSRSSTEKKAIKFKEKEVLDQLLDKLKANNEQVYLMARIYFETGLRAIELVNMNRIEPNWGWNLNENTMWGIGKGNKEFKVRFSQITSDLMINWLQKCNNQDKPFIFFKSGGIEYQNSYNKLIRTLKKYCDITPHQIRHSLGHFLRADKHWDIEQIRKKLRHSKLETTQIYVTATDKEIAEKEDAEIFLN